MWGDWVEAVEYFPLLVTFLWLGEFLRVNHGELDISVEFTLTEIMSLQTHVRANYIEMYQQQENKQPGWKRPKQMHFLTKKQNNHNHKVLLHLAVYW